MCIAIGATIANDGLIALDILAMCYTLLELSSGTHVSAKPT